MGLPFINFILWVIVRTPSSGSSTPKH